MNNKIHFIKNYRGLYNKKFYYGLKLKIIRIYLVILDDKILKFNEQG